MGYVTKSTSGLFSNHLANSIALRDCCLTLSVQGYEQHDDDMCNLMFHAAKIGRENDTAKFAGHTTRKADR